MVPSVSFLFLLVDIHVKDVKKIIQASSSWLFVCFSSFLTIVKYQVFYFLFIERPEMSCKEERTEGNKLERKENHNVFQVFSVQLD